jgi:hypothetical protein
MGVNPFKKFGLLLAVLAVLFCNQLVAQIRPPTWPDVPLPEGTIRNILLDNCTSCHGIDDYAFFALDSAEWESLLAEKHVGDSRIETSDEEKAILLQYLSSNFGSDSIPFPRDYVPPEITEFFNNADARIFMEVRCISCHSLDPIMSNRRSPEGWRVLLVNERERGAKLNDEELERLAEWLGRARGINLFE